MASAVLSRVLSSHHRFLFQSSSSSSSLPIKTQFLTSLFSDLIAWLNRLYGEIPQELMHLQNLENLILDFNNLSGSIPAGLSNCTNLNWISLSNNQLTGEIPASLGQLGNQAILTLGNNSLSGNIPAELGDCRSLLWLDLNSNFLNGTIPSGLSKQAGNIAAALLTRKQYGYIKNDGTSQCHGAGRKIAIGAARGLAFLHHNCIPHIIHRDMKSSNVLLDDNLEARVSDFGMARHMGAMETHLSVSTLAGTPGYVPPEYYQSFRCSTKGDVYSYGVVLLELLTGRQPTDSADFGDTIL